MSKDRFAGLTKRERQVLQALCSSKGTNKAVAEKLGMSPKTVQAHLRSVALKTGLRSRVAMAVAWTRQTGGKA